MIPQDYKVNLDRKNTNKKACFLKITKYNPIQYTEVFFNDIL